MGERRCAAGVSRFGTSPTSRSFGAEPAKEYLHLYEVTARAVKAVDTGLMVGGPASAAVDGSTTCWPHAVETGAPIDFLSTHTYGNEPLDLRPIAARYGRNDLELWWTEWGVHASHFDPLHDSVYAAAFCARGMRSAMGRLHALAYLGGVRRLRGAWSVPHRCSTAGSVSYRWGISGSLATGRSGCSSSSEMGSWPPRSLATVLEEWSMPSPPWTADDVCQW